MPATERNSWDRSNRQGQNMDPDHSSDEFLKEGAETNPNKDADGYGSEAARSDHHNYESGFGSRTGNNSSEHVSMRNRENYTKGNPGSAGRAS
ncbi:MAG: hypothetical protein EOO51_07100 [Flavobacterium sp.]|nr:MAG: hypothetical protein EOO51_07100 [Flavobacterium sp.]